MRISPLPLLFAIFIILAFGLTTIWSTANDLFWTQLIFIVCGVVICLVISKIDLTVLATFSRIFYIISIFLLLITFVLGQATRGSTRWIDLGFVKLQFSELIKPSLVIFFASFASTYTLKKFRNIIMYLTVLLLPTLLVFIQPDLGSSLVILVLGLSILFVSDISKKNLLLLVLISLAVIIPGFEMLKPYQKQRLTSFMNPYNDPGKSGYNIIQSVVAVGSGQIIGLGVRQGTQSHLKFLPERHTDFAFASFAEEFGLIGAILLLFSYVVLLFSIVALSFSLSSKFDFYIANSIFAIFAFQIIVNIGMNLGVLPITGITLPLFSYGGSSIFCLSALLGLVFNLNSRRRFSY